MVNPENQGRSLKPPLDDPGREWPYPAITGWLQNSFAVQTERHRHIRNGDGSEELYDHQTDLQEWTNLAGKVETEVVRRELAGHLAKAGIGLTGWLPLDQPSKPADSRSQPLEKQK